MVDFTKFIRTFYGIDFMIDLFSLIVLILITITIFKFYKLKKESIKIKKSTKINNIETFNNTDERKYKLFIISFLFLSISFIFKLFTYIILNYVQTETKVIGFMTITYQTVKTSSAPIFWGFLLFRIISLFSFYLLYLAYTRKDTKINIENPGKSGITLRNSFGMLFMMYLLIIAGYFSQSIYYVYYTTCFFLLFLITETIYEIYSVNKNLNTLFLSISFAIIMLSHGVFIFLNINSIAYMFAEIIQLIGYIALLITFMRTVYPVANSYKKSGGKDYAKKKRKA